MCSTLSCVGRYCPSRHTLEYIRDYRIGAPNNSRGFVSIPHPAKNRILAMLWVKGSATTSATTTATSSADQLLSCTFAGSTRSLCSNQHRFCNCHYSFRIQGNTSPCRIRDRCNIASFDRTCRPAPHRAEHTGSFCHRRNSPSSTPSSFGISLLLPRRAPTATP